MRFSLDENDACPALLIHGALSGQQEKYLQEFPLELQQHVEDRRDLWLRLTTGPHIRDNFATMDKRGIQYMFRGHDHFLAIRSLGSDGTLFAHEIVSQSLPLNDDAYAIVPNRQSDEPDEVEKIQPDKLADAKSRGEFHWHTLQPDRKYVINFGPYYDGSFGLVRTGSEHGQPELAFCRVEPSFYTANDRQESLGRASGAQQLREGKNFYDLFPGRT